MKHPLVPVTLGILSAGLIVWTSWTMRQLPPLEPKLPSAMMPVMYRLFSEQPVVLLAIPVVLTVLALWCLRARAVKTGLYVVLLGMSLLFLALLGVSVPPTLDIAKNGPKRTIVPAR